MMASFVQYPRFPIQYRKKLLPLVVPVTRLVEIVKTHVVRSMVLSSLDEI